MSRNRCDCCGCVIEEDYGTSTVTGSGTADDPYIVSAVDTSFVRPSVRVSRSTVSIPNNTPTVVTWVTEEFDDGGLWTGGAPTRITFPVRGIYAFGARAQWPNNATGQRLEFWRLNGATTIMDTRRGATTGVITNELNFEINYQYPFEVGDYIELLVSQTSGGNLNLQLANAWAVWLGDF